MHSINNENDKVGFLAWASSLDDSPNARWRAFDANIKRNKINIAAIFRDEFVHTLLTHRNFPGRIVPFGKERARFFLTISDMAFLEGFVLLGRKCVFTMSATAQLITPTNVVAWRQSDYVTNLNPQIDSYRFWDVANSKELSEKMLRGSAAAVSKGLISQL